ncbi:hypothetical protein CYY_009205 [Polysphondylium violaceum]|uniref:Cytochrome P450 family protein n=1 Tax=Polysphondylium violaceum TaxID=133409 RepID=A0A8J4PLZ0_9MYCE|nr:hypothetical protein CYY_009205 [Polysphondylium violaceum]
MIQTILIIFLLYIVYDFIYRNKKYTKNDPPGPIAYPLVGDLPRLSKLPHINLLKLHQKYGDVIKVWMGDFYTIIINDPVVVREIFVKHFDNFTDRSHPLPTKLLSNNFRNLISGDYVYWKRNRDLVSHAFTNTKLRSVSSLIELEANRFIQMMNDDYVATGQPFCPRLFTKKYTLSVTLQYIFSGTLPLSPNDKNVDEKMVVLAKEMDNIFLYIGRIRAERFISSYAWVCYMLKKYVFAVQNTTIVQCMKDIMLDHIKKLDPENPKDLLDYILCNIDIKDPEEIKIPLMIGTDLMVAGTETTASAIEFFFMVMVNYPQFQELAHTELAQVVGKGNKVTLAHKKSTPYFMALLKEVIRKYPIAPLSLARSGKQDILIADKYFIPKDVQLFINIHALSNSDKYWDKPNEFNPDRFLNNNHSDVFLPFGVGPRNCIGSNLAMDEYYIFCANMILNFTLSSVDGKPIDETLSSSLSLILQNEFSVLLKHR